MFNLKNTYNILIGIAFWQIGFGQELAQSTYFQMPENCAEIQILGQEILDSSLFFKGNSRELTKEITTNTTLSKCEFYPLILTITGFQSYISNDILESREKLLEADSLYKVTKVIDSKYDIRNKIFLGLNYNIYGDTIKAISYYNSAIKQCVATKNISLLADANHNLSTLYLSSGRIELARQLIEEAITLAKNSNNLEVLGFANSTYCRLLIELGDFNSARKHILKAKEIFTKLDNQGNLYLVDLILAEILIEKKEINQAILTLKEAEKRGNMSKHKFQNGLIYKYLGDLYQDIDKNNSLQFYEKAQESYAGLSKEEYRNIVAKLTESYSEQNQTEKLAELVDKLLDFQLTKDAEKEIEFKETIDREKFVQKESAQNEILQLKNKEIVGRIWIISLASIGCMLLAFYALQQWKKNQELNKRISAQNEKLAIQNAELKNFVSIASHDLKAPSRSIFSFVSLLEKFIPQSSDPKIFQYLSVIKKSSLNMNSLVKDLLRFTTLDNFELELDQIDMAILLNEVIDSLFNLVELNDAKIVLPENLPNKMQGDETLIRLVFQNILNNALKFVDQNKSPIIKIEYEFKESNHVFSIKDNGIGIEEKYLKRIFLIFQRLHSSREFEGSGIGLATCKKIIDLHNGEIDIKSQVGKGSTFIVSLPASVNQKAAS